jgi:glutaredoxin 3
MSRVTIYCTTDCPYCVMAKKYFEREKIAYIENDITDDEATWERLSNDNKGWRTVPMIFIDGHFIGGFDELTKLGKEGKLKELKGP